MAIQQSCDCGNEFLVDAADRGKQVRCPACRGAIPAPDDGPIAFVCAKCGNAMKARASYAGRQTNCPKCQAPTTVPSKETQHTPLVKKSSSRRIVLIVAVLLLVGGIFLALLLTRKGTKDGIDDLSLVPADAQGLACVKVDAIWQTPAVQKAIRDKPDLGKRFENELGLKPEEVERATLVLTDGNKGEGWVVVKTKQPYDAKALRERFREPNDPLFYVDPDPNAPPAFAPVGPRVFVLGMDAGVRRALALVGSPMTKGLLAPVVEMCRKPDHVVFGYNPRWDGGTGKRLVFGIDLSALDDVEVLLGTLNIREKAELDVRARTASKEKAADLLSTTKGLLTKLDVFLLIAQWRGGEKGRQMAQARKLLDTMKFSIEDKDVVATMKADTDIVLPLLLDATR